MGTRSKADAKFHLEVTSLSDEEIVHYRAALEVEMRRRGLGFSVGQIGESLVIEHFKRTPGLPKLLRSPIGTKNVDALSRNGERYSIKTVWNAKKTSTIYPDPNNKETQLFEFLIIGQLSNDMALKNIYEFSWEQFAEVRSWDKRMNAWYIGCSTKTLEKGKRILAQS